MFNRPCRQREGKKMASPPPSSILRFAGLGQFYVKTIENHLNAENQPEISWVSPHLAVRETFKRSRTPSCVKPEGSVSHRFTQITRVYSIIGAWRRTNYRFWMCGALTTRKTLKYYTARSWHAFPESAECWHENHLKRLGLTNLT